MIINTTQVEMVLNNKAIPAYSLEAETGVSRDRISKLRRGDIKFENMSLNTIMKIQKWIDDGIKIVSPNSPQKFIKWCICKYKKQEKERWNCALFYFFNCDIIIKIYNKKQKNNKKIIKSVALLFLLVYNKIIK